MKKRRLLVFGLIAALLLTGAAYAAWTDSVDVVVAASTGEVSVIISSTAIDNATTSTHIDLAIQLQLV